MAEQIIGNEGVSGCLGFTLPEGIAPATADKVFAHWQQQLAQRVKQFNGQLDTLQPGVFWLFFADDEPALALRRCLKALWPVLTKPVELNGKAVVVQLGLARGEQGDPYHARKLTSTSQRCILPEDLACLLPPGLATKPLNETLSQQAINDTIDDVGQQGTDSLKRFVSIVMPVATKVEKQKSQHAEQLTTQVSQPAETMEEPAKPEALSPQEETHVTAQQQAEPVSTLSSSMATVAAMAAGSSSSLETSVDEPAIEGETLPQEEEHPHEEELEGNTVSNLFDIPVNQYSAPVVQPVTTSEPEHNEPSEPAKAITRPSSPPTIPEVVSKRYSVTLPDEPEASSLPVFDGLGSNATLGASSSKQLSPKIKQPYVRSASALGFHYQPDSYFDSAQPAPGPTHTYSEIPNALLQAVQHGLSANITDAAHRRIALVGPSGCGKTAWLTHGLLQQLIPDPQQPSVIWFAAQPAAGVSDAQHPFGLWRDLLQRAIPVPPEGADTESLKKWVQQSLDQVFNGETDPDHYHVFEHLLNLTSHNGDNRLEDIPVGNLLADFFHRMAGQMPIVIVLDDLHRADAASIELLIDVWNALPNNAPIVWLTSWNTEAGQPTGNLSEGFGGSITLVTHGLDNTAFDDLFNNGPFQGMNGCIQSSLMQQCRENAVNGAHKGSLLYISEVLTWLHAQNVLVMAGEGNQITANPEVDQSTIQIPATLHDIYQARLTWLSPSQQELLAWAATLGERFSIPLLNICAGQPSEEFQHGIQALAAQQWILTDFEHIGQFRHPSLHAFLTEQLTEVDSRQSQISQHLLSLAQQNTAVPTGIIATQSTNPAQQRDYWVKTAALCGQLGSLTGLSMALSNACNALQKEAYQYTNGDIPQSLIREEMTLKTQIAEAHLTQQEPNANPQLAAELLPTIVDFHRHEGNQASLVGSLGALMVAFERIGHLQGALEVVDNCLDAIGEDSQQDNTVDWVTLQAQRATILEQLGQLAASKDILDHPLVIQHLRDAAPNKTGSLNRLRDKVATVNGRLIWQLLMERPSEKIDQLIKTVSVGGQLALRLEAATAAIYTGQFDDAHGLLEHCLPQIENQDNPAKYLGRWGLAAMRLHRLQPNREEADQLIMPSLEQAQLACDYPTWISLNLEAARLQLADNKPKEALEIAESMALEASERRLAQSALESWQVLAASMSAIGQHQQAEDILRRALGIAEKPNIGYQLKRVALSIDLADVLLKQGELQQASDILQPMWPNLKDSEYIVFVKRGASVISKLYTALAKRQPDGDKRQEQLASAEAFSSIANS